MKPQKDNCPRSAATTWWSQDYNQYLDFSTSASSTPLRFLWTTLVLCLIDNALLFFT